MWPGSDREATASGPFPPPAGRAVPSPGPFAELLGQPYQRLKVAVLRELAGLPQPSWPLADAEQALTWLDPATANRLLSELRADGLVVGADRHGDAGPPAWRLSDEGHLVATVSAVLAAPRTAPERAVKVLGAAMALARAVGVDERVAFAPFMAATAVLERDHAALVRLIDQGADDALPAAAHLAGIHLTDLAEMAKLVGRHGHDAERLRAAAVAGRLRALVAEVEGAGAGSSPPDPPPAAGPTSAAPPATLAAARPTVGPPPSLDAGELRALVAAADPGVLAALVAGRLRLPPAVAPVRAGDALAALDEHLGRPEPVVVPLPEPTLLPIESPEVVPDFVLLAADVMTWLAGGVRGTPAGSPGGPGLGGTDLATWVVGGTWAEATARMAAVVEAWSRWGPAGDGSLGADLVPQPRLQVVGHDEVGVVSWTGVRAPPAARPATAPPAVVDPTVDPAAEGSGRGGPGDPGGSPGGSEPHGGAPVDQAGSDRQEVAT
jgi:hypothetical protein